MLTERYRLGELAAEACARLVDLQAAAGDADAAVETARRLVALTPLDEAAHARLIQLYGVQGRRGLAEAHYARCSELLQRELGQAPGDEFRAALADARRPSSGKSVDATPGPPRSDPDGRHDRPQHPRHWTRARWATSAAAAAMALLIGAFAWLLHEKGISGVGEAGSNQAALWDMPTEPSIAVLPFENLSGDPEQEYFVDGITGDITTNLSKFSTLFVTAADSSFRYKGAGGDRARHRSRPRRALRARGQRTADRRHASDQRQSDRRHDRPACLGRALRAAEPERLRGAEGDHAERCGGGRFRVGRARTR